MPNALEAVNVNVSCAHPDVCVPEVSSRLAGKRVAMVVFSSYPADPRPRRAVDALLKEGMTVDLVCLKEEQASRNTKSDTLNVYRIPIGHHRGGKLSYAYEYSAFILISASILALRSLKRRYDLVYIHNMPDVLVLTSLIPKMLGAKVILDLHDPMPELMTTIYGLDKASRSVRIIRQLESWSIARANAVVTVNAACKRVFASRSCSAEKISVVMNSPDEKIFRSQSPASRRQGSKATDDFVILYHGSLVERNGLELAVAALAKVRTSVPGAKLKICGRSTPFLERVMQQVRNMNLQGCVECLGPKNLEDIVLEIEACDVGVIPNQRNAFTDINTPTRIFEFLALGKPVIAPQTIGIADYFAPDALFFFDLGNADSLAEQIIKVASHPHEARDVVRRGQQVYATHTWREERQVLVDLVSKLLS